MTYGKLTIGTAMAALMIGGIAQAQSPDSNRGGAPAYQNNSGPSVTPRAANPSDAAPAEKTERPGTQNGPRAQNPGSATTGQSPSRSGEMNKSDGDKSGTKSGTSGQAPARSGEMNKGDRDKSGTSGQAPSRTGDMKKGDDKSGTNGQAPNRSGEMNKGDRDKSGAAGKSGAATSGAGAAGAAGSSTNTSVNLSTEQRTKIKSVIVQDRSAPRVSSVDFRLNVGTVVPQRVKLAAVPGTIIEIQPSWRGYQYFLVGDDIVIVEPDTLRIVAVIPA